MAAFASRPSKIDGRKESRRVKGVLGVQIDGKIGADKDGYTYHGNHLT